MYTKSNHFSLFIIFSFFIISLLGSFLSVINILSIITSLQLLQFLKGEKYYYIAVVICLMTGLLTLFMTYVYFV